MRPIKLTLVIVLPAHSLLAFKVGDTGTLLRRLAEISPPSLPIMGVWEEVCFPDG